jgi:C-terminal processing protease CtpA/Prc
MLLAKYCVFGYTRESIPDVSFGSREGGMKTRLGLVLAPAVGMILMMGTCLRTLGQQQKLDDNQRERAVIMLQDVHDAVKKNYYDTNYHGLDVDARFKEYKERVKKSETLGDAFRTIAAYVAGLDDSHTFFIPPRRSYRAEYGYQMQMVGDNSYVTEVRPESDAAQKLHPGDQVLTLNGFGVNRKDLWQLEYFLNQLAPRPASEFMLRDPSGKVRKEQVLTKYIERKRLKDLTMEGGLTDNYELMFEEERARHVLRSRYIEQGEVMIWKMPIFDATDDGVDHLVGLARKHKHLILDLRGNPGGYVTTLSRMIGSFFDHDIQIGMRVMRKGEKPWVAKSRGNATFSGNLIVLVDSDSASAAEIFARVVQLEHRGTVLGDRSSGSVMEALHYPFQAGADIQVFYSVSVTSADLRMADGKSLEKTGVTPDEILLPTAAQLADGQDPVLARAAELAGIKLDPAAAGKLFPFEWSPL